ncbi:HicB family protein [filamentous cyanobacterium CCP1]|nr:HicB family protein [filamentous cyanobacterium CCP2]PSB67842.1 HicB family protein [filamentous cyanobacterium CCP1]
MLTQYIQAAMQKATFEVFQEDGSFYGEIPGFQGVWANATTLEGCREELQSVLEDWILVRIADHLPLPIVNGIELKPQEEVA